jgi:phage-related baseplate assembly protein
MLTDAVVIKDAFIINIGVNFDVILQPNFNNRVVLNNCINALIDYFDIDKWQINQPILINNVRNVIDNIEGVQTVKKLQIVNKVGTNENYSEFAYDMRGATIDEVIYPSLDPSIFELKFPETDIQGRVVTN